MQTSNLESLKYSIKIAWCMAAVCGLALVVASLSQVSINWWREIAIFALLSLLAQLAPARLPQGYNFSLAFIMDLIVIVLYGLSVATVTRCAVTLLAGLFTKFLGHGDSMRNVFFTTVEGVLTVELAGAAYYLTGKTWVAFTAATIVYFLVNSFFAALYGLRVNREQILPNWISVIRSLYIYFFVLSILAYLLTDFIRDASMQWKIFSVMLFFIPVLLVNHSLRLYTSIKQNYLNTVKTMIRAIEAKDHYMKGHSEHVAELTLAMAREIGIKEKELQQLQYVALLHDAGKIGVSEEILNKPGPLTDDEYKEVQKHSALSAEIIGKINFLSPKSEIVRHHHERYDGTGYPDGLSGGAIPLASRILAIADAYDAMITDRPFRSAKTHLEALGELEEQAGRQFDPALVEKFKTVLKRLGEL